MDLFGKQIDTRENAVMRMKASAVVCFIDAARRKLPKTVGLKWHHNFLTDIRGQLAGGYRTTLTPAQTGHLLRSADHAGIRIEDFNNGDLSSSKKKENSPCRKAITY